MRTVQRKGNLVIRKLVEKILASGKMTRQEHVQLTSLLLSAQTVNADDRSQINRIFDSVQTGRLKISDQ